MIIMSDVPLARRSETAQSPPSANEMSDAELPPLENPPGYVAARRPTHPITYTFTPLASHSMLLLPPSVEEDSRPAMFITTGVNCFIPTSFITTVKRGSEYGDSVAEFEMGVSTKPPSVTIRGKGYPLNDLFTLTKRHATWKGGFWHWKFARSYLAWDCAEEVMVCTSPDLKITYATFAPAAADALLQPGVPVVLKQLTVLPEGQIHFDDIVVSALILERKRLTPIVNNLIA